MISSSRQLANIARTWLFVPGDRPERFQKATAAGADMVILDLEDAVAQSSKDAARQHVVNWLSTAKTTYAVRVNAIGTNWHDADLSALENLPNDLPVIVMLPMSEDPAQIAEVIKRLPQHSVIVALIETALGVTKAVEIAKLSGVERLALGSYDLAAELGVDPDFRPAMAVIRSGLVLGSAIAGLAGPIEGVTGDIDNLKKLKSDVSDSASLGFAGKLCIHPKQVAVAAVALSPSEADLMWAARITAAVADGNEGVVLVDGTMVDAPVVKRAHRILAARRPKIDE